MELFVDLQFYNYAEYTSSTKHHSVKVFPQSEQLLQEIPSKTFVIASTLEQAFTEGYKVTLDWNSGNSIWQNQKLIADICCISSCLP